MCKAFSCLVLKSGEVKWKMGSDSHSSLATHFGLREFGVVSDTADMRFTKVEITPDNGDYLHPNKWTFKIDESITPLWWTPVDEKSSWKAHREWQRELSKLVVKKKIVNPFKLNSRTVNANHIEAVRQWASVVASVWASVVASVGDSVWASVGASVGDSVWAYNGSFFNLPRKAWKYTENIKSDVYPFESACYLWEQGFVPSFDGKKWRLHAGRDAKVVWECEIEALRVARVREEKDNG